TRVEHWADLYARINTRGARAGAFRNGVNVTSDWGPLSEDMSFVDHIEFVKGPAGFMMSNGEPAGIYNVVTKKPTGNGFNGEASVTMGSFDLYRASVDVDGKLNKHNTVLYRLNVMGQNKNSFRPYEYSNRYLFAPVLTFRLDDQTSLTAEYTYQHVKMSDPGSMYSFSTEGYATLPRDFTLISPGLDPTNIDDHSAFLNLQHHFNERWKFTAQLSYFNYTQTGANVWPDQVFPDGKIIRGDGIWDARSQYKFGQAYFNGEEQTGAVHHRILAGLDLGTKNYYADFVQYYTLDTVGGEFDSHHPDYGPPNNGYPVWDRTTPLRERAGYFTNQTYTGLYLQDELGFFHDRARLTVAGRYTYVKQDEGGPSYHARKFTPRAGLSVSITPQLSVYALFDQTFVPQTGLRKDGGKIHPIEGNNLEAGIKKDWFGGKWNSTLSVYRILKHNELTPDPTNAGPDESFVVVLGETKTQGVEFDLRGELLPGLNLIANYAYTDAKISQTTMDFPTAKVGDRVPGYATHNANAWLSYKQQKGLLKGFGLAGGFTYLSDRDSWVWGGHDGIAALPDYFRLDGSVFWEKGKIRLTVNAYNLLNKYLYSGNWEDWAGYYSWQTEAGTNYRFNINYRF
ncbi:MAG TPA: TonB-dependent siderophore receptor, partial [Chitinophaga sp.]